MRVETGTLYTGNVAFIYDELADDLQIWWQTDEDLDIPNHIWNDLDLGIRRRLDFPSALATSFLSSTIRSESTRTSLNMMLQRHIFSERVLLPDFGIHPCIISVHNGNIENVTPATRDMFNQWKQTVSELVVEDLGNALITPAFVNAHTHSVHARI